MPKLQGQKELLVRTGPNELKRYLVTFSFISYKQVIKAAMMVEGIKFQAAMRGSSRWPDTVATYELLETITEG